MTTWIAVNGSPARTNARLLIGAWDHAGNLAPRPVLGGVDVSASVMDTIDYVERFLAVHLKGDACTDSAVERCRVLRTGAMKWETLDDGPNPRSEQQDWRLGEGRSLAAVRPTCAGADTYRYDPRNPVWDFSNFDVFAWSDPPLDARYIVHRDDVLVYTSAELGGRLNVSGRALFKGFGSVECLDTDLAVALHGVYPGGALDCPRQLIDPMSRAPRGAPVRASPTRQARLRAHPGDLAPPQLPSGGHRIRFVLSSSAFPGRALNFNTGENWANAIEPRVANVTLHHGAQYSSRLVLPVER
jgi:putative CocE/NonD family hydrolase